MSQHTMIIANADGAAVRADINLALPALASTSIGATEPSTMYAGQLWADTTDGTIKLRNVTNTAWLDTGVSITAANTIAGGIEVQGQLYVNHVDGIMFSGASEQNIAATPIARVQGVATATQTISSTGSWVAVTSLTAAITPRSTSSIVRVAVDLHAVVAAGGTAAAVRITRGGSAIGYVGDAAGSRLRAAAVVPVGPGGGTIYSVAALYDDAPASVAEQTYAVEVYLPAGTCYINRSETDTDSASYARLASALTVTEIAPSAI